MENPGTRHITIDGRNHYEESLWWNGEEREKNKRPGPGILPSLLADTLHHPYHSLFSVTLTSFPLLSTVPSLEQSVIGSSTPLTAASPSREMQPPSEMETRHSVPHPDAYYCPRDHGWVILCWKSSTDLPPLAQSYLDDANLPLPDHNRRRRTSSCIGKTNMTHHFHKYEKSVDGHKLDPPFCKDQWKSFESMEEAPLLDLYVCCQCSFYAVASGIIPGVIPKSLIEELVRDRTKNPPAGKSREQAVGDAIKTIVLAVENILWRGERRAIKVMRPGFKKNADWTPNIHIFELLGFIEAVDKNPTELMPPNLSTPLNNHNRRKLLRAWLEFNVWLADYQRANAAHFKDGTSYKVHVRLDSAREIHQIAIGAHPKKIPPGVISDPILQAVLPSIAAWHGLGITLTTFSGDLLAFAYLAQCRCDPAGTPQYYTYLTEIIKQLSEYGGCPTVLQTLQFEELSRYRFTFEDITAAIDFLGFGADNTLGVEYDEDTPDEVLQSAWEHCVKRSWKDPQNGAEARRLANDSFRVLTEMRGSAGANNEYKEVHRRTMQ